MRDKTHNLEEVASGRERAREMEATSSRLFVVFDLFPKVALADSGNLGLYEATASP